MRKKAALLLSLLIFASLLLAACGGTEEVVEEPTVAEEEVAEPVEEATEEPEPEPEPVEVEKRQLVVAQGEGVESWDPPAGWDTASEWIEMNVYDCLVYPDRDTGEMKGWLATGWELADDNLTWSLDLRDDVTFHNGDPFTCEDAKYSIERILNGSKEEFIVFDQWSFVDQVTCTDDYSIEIVTAAPDPSFLSELSGTGCGVVSKKYVEEVGNDGLANFGIGTGPFKVVEYDRESYVILEANEDYWGGKPEVDELVFRVIPEPATRVAELLAGGVNLITGVLPQEIERIEAESNLKIVRYLTDRVYGLSLAHTPPPDVDGVATSDPDIRAAIDYAIDRDELIDLAGAGMATLTRLTPPIPCWDAVDPPLYGVNPYDPEKAKEYMEKAGYPDVPGGPTITVHGTFGQYIAQKEIAETIAAMLEEVGFEVELDIREYSTFRETVYQGNNEELMLQSLGNFTTDPWLFILNYDTRFGERTSTRTRHSFPEIDELAAQANVEMDPDERCRIINEFAHKVVENRPTIELFQMSDTMGMNSNIEWNPPADGMLLFVNVSYND